MKKLLLLMLVVAGIVGCNKDDDNKSLTPFEESLRFAYDYGIDTIGISHLTSEILGASDEILFNYVQNNKLKAKQYRQSTKILLYEFEDNEPFKWGIKYNVPYVGEVVDSITHFQVIFFDATLASGNYRVKSGRNNNYQTLFFIKNKKADKKKTFCYSDSSRDSGVAFINMEKWYNDSWIIYMIEWNKNNNGTTEKKVTNCYDKYGEVLFNVKSSIPNIPLSMSEGISFNELIISRINIQTGDVSWSQTVNLNIPETAKYELTKSELFDIDTVKAVYNITLYDGTKTTKTVNIDVNTGEYTVI